MTASDDPELRRADALRERDRRAAVVAYAALPPERVCADSERAAWLVSEAKDTLAPELRPLMLHVVATLDGLTRRRAVDALASMAWYGGRAPEAGRYWREALDAGRDVKDAEWLIALLNLSLVYFFLGRYFESLVLSGRAVTHALQTGEAALAGLGHARRGMVLFRVGEYERALRELEQPPELARAAKLETNGALVLAVTWLWRSRLAAAQGEVADALAHALVALDHTERMDPSRSGKLRYMIEGDRLSLEYALQPARRRELLEALERRAAAPHSEVDWMIPARLEALRLRMRYELDEVGDRASALLCARELLDEYPVQLRRDALIEEASDLARVLGEEFGAPDLARHAYELAAAASLRRIAEVHQVTLELPELSAATPEDWEVLANYRRRLVDAHATLSATIRAVLDAGHPALDLLRTGEAQVRACAWCLRISTRDGRWLPLAQFLPSELDFEVTHGICADCSAREVDG
ncbi:MAG: hypothetical protein H6828_10360 [Planctomycetes bacterium]|nr:hypothetical protein [Planctomycetota bacterium]